MQEANETGEKVGKSRKFFKIIEKSYKGRYLVGSKLLFDVSTLVLTAYGSQTLSGTCTTKFSTTTVVNSSDAQLKRRADAIFPAHATLRKTQSEHGGRLLTVPQEEGREKSPPTAEELREALKEVSSLIKDTIY